MISHSSSFYRFNYKFFEMENFFKLLQFHKKMISRIIFITHVLITNFSKFFDTRSKYNWDIFKNFVKRQWFLIRVLFITHVLITNFSKCDRNIRRDIFKNFVKRQWFLIRVLLYVLITNFSKLNAIENFRKKMMIRVLFMTHVLIINFSKCDRNIRWDIFKNFVKR